ncbi:MAG: rubredoxin [Woeseia sp.]|nr:rubredoxin [Woeseia sp.]
MSVYQCPECDYRFDEDRGDHAEGYPPGTRFQSLPASFTCPDCSVRHKEDFLQLQD